MKLDELRITTISKTEHIGEIEVIKESHSEIGVIRFQSIQRKTFSSALEAMQWALATLKCGAVFVSRDYPNDNKCTARMRRTARIYDSAENEKRR